MSAADAIDAPAGGASPLTGHEEAARQFAESFASGRMHHAWLIAGIEGIGKSLFALHAAAHVLAGGRHDFGVFAVNDRAARLVQAESHPDLLIIRRAADEKTGALRNVIVVDDALKLASFLHKTSTHGGWRVAIVDEAHALNRNAQNAILKILEEPPARALILMTATTPGALLPTIRSRSRLLPLGPLDDAAMRAIVARVAPQIPGGDMERLLSLAGGSAGFALKIARTEGLELYGELTALLDAPGAPAIDRLHKLADRLAPKGENESFDVVAALLIETLRRGAADYAEGGGSRDQLDRRMRLWEETRATFAAAANGNLDRKLALVKAAGEIWRGRG